MISKSKGMTFIEVLVALFVMVTGILGAVALQATAKKGSFDAMQRSVASALAQDILERIRSNDPDPAIIETYEGTYGAALNAVPANRCDNNAVACTPAQMVTNDLYEWEMMLMGADVKKGSANVGGLVGARGCITHQNNALTVVVSWQGREDISDGGSSNSLTAQACGNASDKRRQIEISAFVF